MRLKIYFGSAVIRNWHIHLLNRLAKQPGFRVAAEVAAGPPSTASTSLIDLLFQLETLIHGIPAGGLAAKAPRDALEPYLAIAGGCDLVLDLAGEFSEQGVPMWRLLFNGVCGESALLNLLVHRQSPIAQIVDSRTVVAVGRLGTEYNGIVLSSFEDALARIVTLIVAATTGAGSDKLPEIEAELSPDLSRPVPAVVLAAQAVRELSHWAIAAIYRLCYNSPHWRVGWRQYLGPDTLELGRHPVAKWQNLPDDGLRFYADPFPIEHQGKVTLFVEDFEHRSAKGIISAVRFGADGPVGRPEPVLELPYHLSYPFVFEQGNQVWMIPESCASGTIDLFRSSQFPTGWIKEATLVSEIVASDATLIQHNGTWWLFATVRDGGGAYSDALYLWSAADFRGPFSPHPRNPVLIDIASARPAGRIVCRNGVLLRPVQDCRRGYGHALGIARILSLNQNHFEQTVQARLTAGTTWRGSRIHTLNNAGGFEFIDGSRRSSWFF